MAASIIPHMHTLYTVVNIFISCSEIAAEISAHNLLGDSLCKYESKLKSSNMCITHNVNYQFGLDVVGGPYLMFISRFICIIHDEVHYRIGFPFDGLNQKKKTCDLSDFVQLH